VKTNTWLSLRMRSMRASSALLDARFDDPIGNQHLDSAAFRPHSVKRGEVWRTRARRADMSGCLYNRTPV
jgi:hypothetical protein